MNPLSKLWLKFWNRVWEYAYFRNHEKLLYFSSMRLLDITPDKSCSPNYWERLLVE